MAQAASFDKASAQLYRDYLELLKAFGDFGKLVQEAAGDVTLRQRLVQAPQQVLLEGIPLPIDTEIQFLANTSYRLHLLLPALADKAPRQWPHRIRSNGPWRGPAGTLPIAPC